MTLLFALGAGITFGCGSFLLLKPDLFRVVVGMVLIANAANLTLMASGLTRGRPPIDATEAERVSDPLVQAMTITAVVIGFGVTALLLSIALRIYTTHETVDLDDLSRAEQAREEELEQEELSV